MACGVGAQLPNLPLILELFFHLNDLPVGTGLQALLRVLAAHTRALFPILNPLHFSLHPNNSPAASGVHLPRAPWRRERARHAVTIPRTQPTVGSSPTKPHSQEVVSIFLTFLGGVNERGMLLLFPVLNLLMAAVPSAAPQLLQPALLKLLGLILAGKVRSYGLFVSFDHFLCLGTTTGLILLYSV